MRLMAANTSSLDVCLAGPKIAGSLQLPVQYQEKPRTELVSISYIDVHEGWPWQEKGQLDAVCKEHEPACCMCGSFLCTRAHKQFLKQM